MIIWRKEGGFPNRYSMCKVDVKSFHICSSLSNSLTIQNYDNIDEQMFHAQTRFEIFHPSLAQWQLVIPQSFGLFMVAISPGRASFVEK